MLMLSAVILILLAVAYRVALAVYGTGNEWIANFSPLASIVFCGAVYFPKKYAFPIPFISMLGSDWVLNTCIYHVPFWTLEIVPRYVALGLVGMIAIWIRNREHRPVGTLLTGSLLGSILFYLITNTASWISHPIYSKSFTGWVQALTWGEPGFRPTWTFFRNSVVSDLLFTGLFLGCILISSRKKSRETAVGVKTSLEIWQDAC